MNILDEIAEGYMHNGVVSLEAIEDDIITLENQIEILNSVLRDTKLCGKKTESLKQMLRDENVRLSLLKATFKKESDGNSSYDAIMNVLGVTTDDTVTENRMDSLFKENFEEPAYDEPFDDDLGNVPGVVEMEGEMPYQPGTYTSCDLSSYCDMVNTEFVTAQYNTDKKLICVHFSDPRDYEVFLYLLKERTDRMRFFKKRKPIFIRVRAELGHRVDSYEMGFYGCHVVNVLDNTAIGPFGEEKHFCEAVFKYRNLEIKQTTLLAGPISNNGTTDTKNKAEDKGTKEEDNDE